MENFWIGTKWLFLDVVKRLAVGYLASPAFKRILSYLGPEESRKLFKGVSWFSLFVFIIEFGGLFSFGGFSAVVVLFQFCYSRRGKAFLFTLLLLGSLRAPEGIDFSQS